MQQEQRAEIGQRLDESRLKIRKAVENLADHQWRFVPPEGGWTVAQCLEHVIHVETRVIDKLSHVISTSQPDESWQTQLAGKEELLKARIPGRATKVEMPPGFEYPQGARQGGALLREFEMARDRSVRFLTETREDIRLWAFDHEYFKTLHGAQWMWMIALHSERHANQMEEIRALAEFPPA